MSAELANLQCQFASTKAENEQLHNDLQLARTELAAIRSVLRHPQVSGNPGVEKVPFTSKLDAQPCGVYGDPASCMLTLKINVDGLMAERSRRAALATPTASEPGEGCLDVEMGALCEPLRYP